MNLTSYKGIDYSLGQSNINLETGIRYGVINQNAVGEAWFDESEPEFGMIDCHECGFEFSINGHYGECPNCEWDSANLDIEAISYFYINDGYQAEASIDSGDIFITESPYFTYAQFCSPCAPGAVHLENPLDTPNDNNKGYCFGHDWFEGEVAPYPVYSVETGKVVKP